MRPPILKIDPRKYAPHHIITALTITATDRMATAEMPAELTMIEAQAGALKSLSQTSSSRRISPSESGPLPEQLTASSMCAISE